MSGFRSTLGLLLVLGLGVAIASGAPPQSSVAPTLGQISAESESAPTGSNELTEVRSSAGLPTITYLVPIVGVIGLIYTYFCSAWVARQDEGSERMAGIAKNIASGAMSCLKAEY